jgi:hypothetical protein
MNEHRNDQESMNCTLAERPKPKQNGTLETIVRTFPITEQEYSELDDRFGNLAHYAAWQLKKKNSKNSMTNDPDDDVQELRIALMRAGSYYKRQTYIEDSFAALDSHVKDKFVKGLVKELEQLWTDRRRHGANRQKFGSFQELILDRLLKKYVPFEKRPMKDRLLKIDAKFSTYCKQIMWNEQKALGKQITREKSWRTGLVSLSEFDYLAQENQ